jgi:very-short-patch-repair endonuclease
MNDKSSEIPNGWNHPAFDQKGKVICQVCGKKFMILTPSHLKTHNLKYGEYKTKFPDAPITNEEFKAMSKYSRPSKYSDEDIEILGTETVIDEDIPVIDDEFEMPKNQISKDFDTPMEAKKHEILSFLADYLPSVKMDYLIQEKNVQGTVLLSFISDFACPFTKINVEFPDTFWHNQDAFVDPNRNQKLEEHGWKVIVIKSPAPKIKAVERAIRKIV